MRHPAHSWNPLTLALLASVWVAVLPNWPLWRALAALPEIASVRGAVFVFGFGVMIAALTAALLALTAWRLTVKPAISVVVLAAALGAHFMASYGVVIDSTMLTSVLQTDPAEVRDLLTARFAVSLLVLAGMPLAWVWTRRVAPLRMAAQLGRNAFATLAGLALLLTLILALFADLSATMRSHPTMRYLINPLNSFYAVADLAFVHRAQPSGPPTPIGLDAHITPRAAGADPSKPSKPPLLLLVIGETARADHFALNGYARATNPELAQRNALSFRAVSSCGTSTAASLPCMFSHLGKAGFEARQHESENLLDLVQRAGMAVLWVENQAGCKGLCDRIPNASAHDAAVLSPAPDSPASSSRHASAKPFRATQASIERAASLKALCADGECLDEALLVGLDARIAALPANARARGVLVVLHTMGSHGPAYFKRSPAGRKPFLPECTTSALQQCERAALVNAYDNSIVYTDHVLAAALDWLSARRAEHATALLYVSDHGESLGENNLYLHGLPYALAPREQTHVPMLLWQGDWGAAGGGAAKVPVPAAPAAAASAFAAPDSRACLTGQLDAVLTHDHLFHSVLGLLGVQAREYKPALDAFAVCRNAARTTR